MILSDAAEVGGRLGPAEQAWHIAAVVILCLVVLLLVPGQSIELFEKIGLVELEVGARL